MRNRMPTFSTSGGVEVFGEVDHCQHSIARLKDAFNGGMRVRHRLHRI